jgi:hypothetical protein
VLAEITDIIGLHLHRRRRVRRFSVNISTNEAAPAVARDRHRGKNAAAAAKRAQEGLDVLGLNILDLKQLDGGAEIEA